VSILFRTLTLLFAIGIAPITSVIAADFSHKCNSDNSCRIQLKGNIEIGDAERFESLLSELNRAGHQVSSITLLSRGGAVSEALKIGAIVRESMITTNSPGQSTYSPPFPDGLVPGTRSAIDAIRENDRNSFTYMYLSTLDGVLITSSKKAIEKLQILGKSLSYDQDAICASACALIAVSGLYRFGTVGVHHMYVEDKEIDFNDLDAILSQGTNYVQGYLIELRVPSSFVEKMTSTPSNEMTWIDLSEIGMLDPVLKEYLFGKCGGLTSKQSSDKFDLDNLDRYGMYVDPDTNEIKERNLTNAERSYLEDLKRTSDLSGKCNDELFSAAQRKAQGLD
jgi:hypothetical protein